MEEVLEFVLSLILSIIGESKYKNPKTRTWAMTVFFSVFAVILNGGIIWAVVFLRKQGEIVGTVVMGCFALAVAIASLVVILRGHKSNWERY